MIINQFYVVISILYTIINKLFIRKKLFFVNSSKVDMKLNKKKK